MASLRDFPIRRSRDLEAAFAKELPSLLPGLRISNVRQQLARAASRPDIEADVTTPAGSKRRLVIDVKAALAPGRIREALRQLKSFSGGKANGYPMLASAFLTPKLREMCREEGVGYLDLAGNCFIQLDGLYVEKAVDKNPFPARGRPSSIFTPVSSRLLRALLEEPKRAWKLADLTATAQVSRGFTYKLVQRLVGEGYVRKEGSALRLAEPGKLLDDWRDQYDSNRSERFSYYSFERDPARLMKQIARQAQEKSRTYAVTSFSAASLVAPFVRGVGTVQWYVPDRPTVDSWIKALDLRPVEAGANAVVVLPYDVGVFYRTQKVDGITLVGNIQLYLDLYSDPTRGKEQAEFLRKEKVKF